MKKGYFETYPIAKAGFFAFPLLIFIILMESYYPIVAPDGYKSFIIAFEFANTPEQIHTLLSGLSSATLDRIDLGNYIDFGFMLTYVLFLIIFIRATSKAFSRNWLLLGIPVCIIILFADFYENILLFQITDIYSPTVTNDELNSILQQLHPMTWIKWGGLSVVFAVISITFLEKKLRSTIEGWVCAVPFLISFFAFSDNPIIISWFTLSIFIVFFVLILFSFTYNTE